MSAVIQYRSKAWGVQWRASRTPSTPGALPLRGRGEGTENEWVGALPTHSFSVDLRIEGESLWIVMWQAAERQQDAAGVAPPLCLPRLMCQPTKNEGMGVLPIPSFFASISLPFRGRGKGWGPRAHPFVFCRLRTLSAVGNVGGRRKTRIMRQFSEKGRSSAVLDLPFRILLSPSPLGEGLGVGSESSRLLTSGGRAPQ